MVAFNLLHGVGNALDSFLSVGSIDRDMTKEPTHEPNWVIKKLFFHDEFRSSRAVA